MNPKITVLIPSYNSENSIINCINSIINQSYKNIDIIVINDGSNDNTLNKLKELNTKNIKLKIINNKENLGISRSLNLGLELCSSDYIARMDADDTSNKDRLKKQINYLENNKKVDIVGSFQLSVGGYNNGIIKTKISNDQIKSKLLVGPTMLHPTVVFRGSLIYKNNIRYDPNFYLSEDYELWSRLSPLTNFFNIPEILYEYNWDKQKNWENNNLKLIESLNLIWAREIRRFGIKPTSKTLYIHRILANRVEEIKLIEIILLFIYIHRLIINNFLLRKINNKIFIIDRYIEFYIALRKYGKGLIYGHN